MGREGPDQGRKERAGAGLIDRPGAGGWCESEARTSGCGCGTCRATRGWGRWMMTCMPCRNVWRTGPPMRHCHSPGVRCGWASEREVGEGAARARGLLGAGLQMFFGKGLVGRHYCGRGEGPASYHACVDCRTCQQMLDMAGAVTQPLRAATYE